MNQNKQLILFDIDGTLMRGRRYVPLERLRKVVSQNIRRGVVFGIITSRPIDEAKPAYRILRLKGPIISENGACYRLNLESSDIVAERGLRNINRGVIDFLRSRQEEGVESSYLLRVNENKQILKEKKIPSLVLVTPRRIYTASIYVRTYGQKNKRDLDRIYKLLKKNFQPIFPEAMIERLESLGKIIISNTRISRLGALRQLRSRVYKNHKILIISDDEPAPPRTTEAWIEFGSVANGAKDYKARCKYVATKSGATGIIELLRHVL